MVPGENLTFNVDSKVRYIDENLVQQVDKGKGKGSGECSLLGCINEEQNIMQVI